MRYWSTMNTHKSFSFLALAAGATLLLGCSTAAQPRTPAPTDVVATVGTTSITMQQVDEKALQQPAGNFGSLKLTQAIYEARRMATDEIVGNLLMDEEAKRRGTERTALFEQEISSKVAAVTDADVNAWYQANPQRVQGASLDQVRAPIRQLLTQEGMMAARDAFIDKLKAKTTVRIMLDPPRSTVRAGNSPAKGPANAPIEIIEFADFECPFCLAAAPTVKRVLETYGDRVRLVYRNFPLQNHPRARPSAEAAQCANEQGQFWQYHDRLFGDPGKLADADLKQTAVALGLDSARFNACFDSHKYKSVVDSDAQEGSEAGVTGTPAFFINGRLLTGAQPFEAFKRVIDEELAQKK
jgi:protein-disulfide isomerase